MIRIFIASALAIFLTLQPGHAQQPNNNQDVVWVQIEAQASLNAATESLQRHSAELQDVNGFYQGGGWYGIALGPYSPEDAAQVLRVLRAERRIPRDSYIAASSDYERQIWPIGVDQLTSAQAETPTVTDTTETAQADPEPAAQPEPEPTPTFIDETLREARASERLLTRDQRADLQVALKWAGHYPGKIDAAFGGGTRRSMASWQSENGFDDTGVLTTFQRAELLKQYNSVLEGLVVALVNDAQAGIEMKLPTGVVTFDKYETPFAHYRETGDIPAQVLLISQEGNQDTLFGLYEIMQTLKIVPGVGPRERKKNSFILVGEGATMISHTEVSLKNGEIKGFTLVWPAGDEERRTRLLSEMQSSFTRTDGVLDPAAGFNEEQSIDLIAGLEIRKPTMSRSGFYVDQQGTVITTTEVLGNCGQITIDEDYDAEVALRDDALGIAVLRPKESLAPMNVAAFQQNAPRLKSDIAVAGFSYGGILGAPSLTYGELADLKGLNGEETLQRLAVVALDGDAGGPVFDTGGAVLGMLLSGDSSGRQLPEGVRFAANADTLQGILQQAGVQAASTTQLDQIPPAELTGRAAGMTVLVSCWE